MIRIGSRETATNQTAAFGAQSAANQGNALMAGGNARASAYGGLATSANQGIGNYLYYNRFGQPTGGGGGLYPNMTNDAGQPIWG